MDLEYLEALTGEKIEEIEYRGIWVVTEIERGKLAPVSLEVVGKARELADRLGVYVETILMGSEIGDLAKELIRYGADIVHLADYPRLEGYNLETYAKVLGDLIREGKPEIVLFGATDMEQELAPRLAQRLETGLFGNCTDLSIDESERLLLATHPAYGGEYYHIGACPQARPQMVTVQPGVFRSHFADEYRSGEVETVSVELEDVEAKIEMLKVVAEAEPRKVPLSKAKVVVSGGRGMGNEEDFALLKELAEALGGVVAGSRGAVDEGWIGEGRQVGMAGATVKPDLYIACGISGAIQHYIGMQNAKFVAAINKDPNAPIFKVADIGVVGDVREVIPALIEALRSEE